MEPIITKLVREGASLDKVYTLMDQHDQDRVSQTHRSAFASGKTLGVLTPYVVMIGLAAIAATVYAAKRIR